MRVPILCLLFSVPLLAGKSSIDPVPTYRQITVLLDFENPHPHVPLKAMQSELQSILSGAGVSLDLRIKDELPADPQFGDLLIFKMKGNCSTDRLPLGAILDERGPLASTYSSDGEMLSFGEVQCDRVRLSLQRLYGEQSVEMHSAVYGKALGRVVAHEMYHMIANSTSHTKDGVTKSSLSPRELAQGPLRFSADTDVLLRKALKDSH
ncbi:MAG TPA: hypothetical protein VH325_03210 [Bryobacteraceae bacterium]|nr:hypothetical protein [Bryobacteraceae bacterium]